ncbi:MAG: hypothetical protein KA314_12185 [Chloroflexi bacterium]|nr:hypothetical protein [Chloroflexota bacterium]MBP8056594.1 hypothetical protein [Chloroflexota bacterium]
MSQIRPEQVRQINMMMSVVTQVGCGTVLFIGLALGGGMLLDNLLGTGRIITVLLMVGSVPLSLFLIFKIWLRAIEQMQTKEDTQKREEEINS